MDPKSKLQLNEVTKIISQDRSRTNLLKKYEQRTIAYLVQHIPSWLSSNMLTAIGFFGSIIIFAGFTLATYFGKWFLLLGPLGFLVSWFGDSLDGRTAYYRHKPRKWFGFSLDITTDWLGVILVGWGVVIYLPQGWELLGFIFVVLYGWEMITALLRYKISGNYSIDSGILGPTEVRIIISLIIILEIIIQGSIFYAASLACIILFISDIIEFVKILKTANARDTKENAGKKE